MGHYCRVCGRNRPNEKFSGKGHRNHICKDCSRKPQSELKNEKRLLDSELVCAEYCEESDVMEEGDDHDFYEEDIPF